MCLRQRNLCAEYLLPAARYLFQTDLTMSQSMNRLLPFAILVCLCGCTDHPSSCTVDPYCDGLIRNYCENGELHQEQCTGGCLNGQCQNQVQGCDASSYIPSCTGQTAHNCVDGSIVDMVCQLPQICDKGSCVPPEAACAPLTFVPQCNEGKRVFCDSGRISEAQCPGEQTCQSGICVTKPSNCGNGMLDAAEEACDDGKDNGKYGHCRAEGRLFYQPGSGDRPV